MNFPEITGATPFDQLNLDLTHITFAGELTGDMRTALETATATFNKTVPGGSTVRPVFYLDFSPDQTRMTIRQYNGDGRRELPTKELLDQLVAALGLSLPEQGVVTTRIVHGVAPMNAPHQPKAPRLFVPRHEGFRR